MLRLKFLFPLVVIALAFGSCKKKDNLIDGNTAPYNADVPQVKVDNYVNRLFIDLIGREPLDVEMEAETKALRDADLSFASREALIDKLMFDKTYRSGDSSYHHAYFLRFYELTRIRALKEFSTQAAINQELGLLFNALNTDTTTGQWIDAAITKSKIDKVYKLLSAGEEYRDGIIDIHEMYKRCLDNIVFEKNECLNPDNYAETSFDHYLFRLPTDLEQEQAYQMMQNGIGTTHLLGMSGQNKDDFYSIVSSCQEWREGFIRWVYVTYMGRPPHSDELYDHMIEYVNQMDAQQLQKHVLKSNEYANF